jgi:hypothetical protein
VTIAVLHFFTIGLGTFANEHDKQKQANQAKHTDNEVDPNRLKKKHK